MKSLNFAKFALLAMLALSILPGCGKKSNKQDPLLGGGVIGGVIPGTNIPVGGNSGVFSGTISYSNATGYVSGSMNQNGGANTAMAQYSRTAQFTGDRVYLYTNIGPSGPVGYNSGTGTVYVVLANNSCGTPVAVYLQGSLLAPGGVLNGLSVVVYTSYGCAINI